MMDMFFADPSEVPLPPDEVRILNLRVDPYPDGRRVRVFLELTPFQKKPHGDLIINNSLGNPVAESSFVEAITPRLEMTLHLRSFDPMSQYSADLTLFYTVEIEDEKHGDRVLVRPEKQIVDHRRIDFSVKGEDDSGLET